MTVATRRVLVPQAIDPQLPPPGSTVHALAGLSMGSSWSLRWVGPPTQDPQPLRALVERALDAVIAEMSPWEPDSALSRFNRGAPDSWHVLPAAAFEVLQHGLALAEASDGAFDPTCGALVDAWGFGPGPRHDAPDFRPPDAATLAAARAASGWQRLAVDAATRRVRQPGGLRLDFSGIAKGHAVDAVLAQLLAAGVGHALFELGGELRGHGLKPDHQPWWVELAAPPEPAADALPPTRVALHGLAVATSGDYLRVFEHAGRRHPHTIDPRRGEPIAHGLASVCVLHPQCMAADALATALTVLGFEAGARWATQRGVAAWLLQRRADGGFDEQLTPAFEALAA